MKLITLLSVMICFIASVDGQQVKQNDKLHIIIIGAHPDDPTKWEEQPINGPWQATMF